MTVTLTLTVTLLSKMPDSENDSGPNKQKNNSIKHQVTFVQIWAG